MRPNYLELIREHNAHSLLLDSDGMIKALKISYEQGISDGQEEFIQWLSKMDYLSDNINYILEEWKNQKK